VNLADLENSLLLRKASGQFPYGGGNAFVGKDYNTSAELDPPRRTMRIKHHLLLIRHRTIQQPGTGSPRTGMVQAATLAPSTPASFHGGNGCFSSCGGKRP